MRKLRYNGVVTSMDGSMNRYEAIGTQNGKIVFLGTSQEGLAQQWDETVDLKGAAVLPGFNDTHMHLLHYAMFRRNVPLFGVKTIDEVVERCKARIDAEHPDYLIGMGWNQETMEEGWLLTREDMATGSSLPGRSMLA